jgi:hypothetical protein
VSVSHQSLSGSECVRESQFLWTSKSVERYVLKRRTLRKTPPRRRRQAGRIGVSGWEVGGGREGDREVDSRGGGGLWEEGAGGYAMLERSGSIDS